MSVKTIGLNPHPISISTSNQIRHRTFYSPLVVKSLQFTSIDKPPFDHQREGIIVHNPISVLKYKTTF